MTTTSIVQHRSDCYFTKLEEDYIAICSQGKQYPHCKALILAVLEHWMNDKKAKGRDCYVYMTYPQWCDAMFGLYRRSTIIACLTELVEEGLIKKRPCRYAGKDSYEYILDIEMVQQQINDLPEKVGKTIHPSINAFKFKRVQKQTDTKEDDTSSATHSNLNASPPDAVYFQTGEGEEAFKSKHTIESSPEIPFTIDSSSPSPSEQITEPFSVPTLSLRDEVSVDKSSYSHEPAAPSPDKSEWLWESEGEEDIFSEDADPTEKRPVVQGGNLAPGERRAPLESKERREGSNEHPAVKPPSPGPPPASPGRAAQLREQPTGQYNPHEKPRQPTRTPESEAGTPPLPDKTQEKGNRKKDAPLLCETKKVRELIDATRGHALEDPGALINQSKIIHAWCEKHPIEHATLVLHHIMTSTCKKHIWWRAHLDAFSAKALAQLTSEILPELGIIPKPELPPDIPMPAATPQANGKYHPYTRASMYDPIEIGV